MANTKKWDGLVIRTSGGEKDEIPRKVTAGSPDVICAGKEPSSNPDQYTDSKNYGNGYSNQIFENISNYFYIRAKNYHAGPVTAYLHTYWAPSNLILIPSLWEKNYMKTSSGAEGVKVQADKENDIVANTEDAFTWVPTPPQAGTHYCIMAQASTSMDPSEGIPADNFESAAKWADWLAQRGNWGWRNTVYISSDRPDLTETTHHHIVIPGKKGDPYNLYNLYIKCTQVPKGWSFQFTSGTRIPPNPDTQHQNPVNTLSKTKTNVTDPNDNIGAHWYLPPQFNTNISVSVWFNGIPPQKGTKWQLKINQVSDDPSLSIYEHGADIMEHNDPHPRVMEWKEHNLKALQDDMPIGKEVEVGNINFELKA